MSLVTTSDTKAGSALAKNGTDATRDRQLKLMTSCKQQFHSIGQGGIIDSAASAISRHLAPSSAVFPVSASKMIDYQERRWFPPSPFPWQETNQLSRNQPNTGQLIDCFELAVGGGALNDKLAGGDSTVGGSCSSKFQQKWTHSQRMIESISLLSRNPCGRIFIFKKGGRKKWNRPRGVSPTARRGWRLRRRICPDIDARSTRWCGAACRGAADGKPCTPPLVSAAKKQTNRVA